MSENLTRRLRVHGRVQGVFYRNWSREEARRLGLAGWVRNRGDGTVELLVHGPADRVEAMIALCRQGPPAAVVEQVDIEQTDEEASAPFEKRPSA